MLSDLRTRWQSLTSGQRSRSSARRGLPDLVAHGPLVATVVLGLAVAAQAAYITIALISDVAIDASSRSGAVHSRTAPRVGALALAVADVVRAHLFGAAPIEAARASRIVSRAPLVLTGIIATGDPKDGFAILGSNAATARVFHTGSEAAPGVLLTEVYPQWVVVLRGDERVTLRLPQASGGDQAINLSFARTAGGPPGEVADGGDDGVQLPSPSDFKPPPMSTANTLIRAFSLRPVSMGGERGVRIMGTGINSTTLSALGLAPGDVIMQINGVAIGNKNTPDLGKALSTGGVTLVVDRDGDETSVTIDASSAANAANAYRGSAPDL
ncbi:MAG TPA: type II secretion system protein N [Steroidobacteraceae bacterium]|nr:type II secretion system protein N [Steroidobacteraceae bacterium]